eukprot:CAMPEP_0194333924 /NCGR_PEP_ID=MMETSP0171-20130528/64382_1 /TAXON_ID=218684 /ORGANISM="Corethron pennatum, Strain L29A3" /LENGTH=57 /DNA_ID=CAMNT_0039096355 /DNA_START=198 /DNA_END=367 /DNA_ORIENTATION=-
MPPHGPKRRRFRAPSRSLLLAVLALCSAYIVYSAVLFHLSVPGREEEATTTRRRPPP